MSEAPTKLLGTGRRKRASARVRLIAGGRVVEQGARVVEGLLDGVGSKEILGRLLRNLKTEGLRPDDTRSICELLINDPRMREKLEEKGLKPRRRVLLGQQRSLRADHAPLLAAGIYR